jgi:hypothetical protein
MPMRDFETAFRVYLRVGVCVRYTEPDPEGGEVIPFLEKPAEAGINRAPGESVPVEYRA